MDFSRIQSVIDIWSLMRACITIVGCGASAGLVRNLARCGIRRFRLVDIDRVGGENICRQDHMQDQIGQYKAHALGDELVRINPEIETRASVDDICQFDDETIDRLFGDTELFVFATDNHRAQAWGNATCLRLNKPGVWIGMYPNGSVGEVFFWKPGLASCHRCMLSARYAAQEKTPMNPRSDGADILTVTLTDSIAAMIVLGLLTEGSDNRYGRMISQLGDRQLLQVKIDPDWTWNGIDLFRRELQIPASNDAYFSFCTIARRDPEPGGNCPDCRKYRQS